MELSLHCGPGVLLQSFAEDALSVLSLCSAPPFSNSRSPSSMATASALQVEAKEDLKGLCVLGFFCLFFKDRSVGKQGRCRVIHFIDENWGPEELFAQCCVPVKQWSKR